MRSPLTSSLLISSDFLDFGQLSASIVAVQLAFKLVGEKVTEGRVYCQSYHTPGPKKMQNHPIEMRTTGRIATSKRPSPLLHQRQLRPTKQGRNSVA